MSETPRSISVLSDFISWTSGPRISDLLVLAYCLGTCALLSLNFIFVSKQFFLFLYQLVSSSHLPIYSYLAPT